MKTVKVEYGESSDRFQGYAVFPNDNKNKKPAVLICHAWFGQDDFARHKAEKFAQLGYVGFAVDMYGDAKEVDNADDAEKLITPLLQNRQIIRNRLRGALEAIKKFPEVDPARIGIIGFCFGGACALELVRSGADVKAAVSFHGLLQSNKNAKNEKMKASVLVLHGYKDPLVSQDDILNFQQEMNDADIDWQMIIYGDVMHAFTNPKAHSPSQGLLYDKKADERSWREMQNFFKEKFA